MTAPHRSKPAVDNDFEVNEDPEKLDRVYDRILGRDGHKILTEEVKWLAVTHKSFDHGRRGYNERLAFLGMHAKYDQEWRYQLLTEIRYIGRRIVELQTSLTLVHSSSLKPHAPQDDEYGRTPFHHPALEGLSRLGLHMKLRYIDKRRVAQLAKDYGLDTVLRWKPHRVSFILLPVFS